MGERRSRRSRPPSLFWPLVLIGIGVIFLLVNFGYLQANNVWAVLWRFWPVLLVLVGIDILFGGRSLLGAVFSALLGIAVVAAVIALIWFAPQIPALANLQTDTEQRTERVSQPLDGASQAQVAVDVGDAEFTLDELVDSGNLIEADVTHSGVLRFDVNKRGDRADVKLDVHRPNPFTWFTDGRETWDVGLHSGVQYDLRFDGGSGSYDLNLGGLEVSDLQFDIGSGKSSLVLPTSGEVECNIDVGSGELDITLADGMEAHVRLDKGSGSFRPGPRFELLRGREGGDGVWETDDYDTATDRVYMEIDMGSGDISIR